MANVAWPVIDPQTLALVRMAVREDMGPPEGLTGAANRTWDRTVELSIPADQQGTATIVARQAGVICGTFLLETILREYDARLACTVMTPDGTAAEPHQAIAQISGPMRAMLSAERVMLNFLGRLSGVATLTHEYVRAVAHVPPPLKPPAICDTRKTTPGYRRLEKYAVACGGGVNHRMGLYDGVMLKDNHIAALREGLESGLTLGDLARRVRRELPAEIIFWLEVDTLEQLTEALAGGGGGDGGGGADIILLDNFSLESMRAAVELRNRRGSHGKPLLEASGGITLQTIAVVAETGVDRISVGALTHSAPALDVAMEVEG